MQKFKLLESNEKYNSKCLEAGFSLPLSVVYAKQNGDLLTHFILMNLLLPDLPRELVVLVHVARTGKSEGIISCSQVSTCLLSGSPICGLQAHMWRRWCLTGGAVPSASRAPWPMAGGFCPGRAVAGSLLPTARLCSRANGAVRARAAAVAPLVGVSWWIWWATETS